MRRIQDIRFKKTSDRTALDGGAIALLTILKRYLLHLGSQSRGRVSRLERTGVKSQDRSSSNFSRSLIS
ncbi:hypothetical protein [Dendronalium sp. ChiSLP03b]|uniref:hypothetical protein n=1 Tax=Dendronalium sp. ChiSLP03b TaxID=3075381 RepID=UPI00391A0542